MFRPSLLALAAAVLAAAGAVHAQPGPRGGGQLFISPSGEPFRDGDGFAAWFKGADADHDGAISRAEFRADFDRFFKELDKNKDGVISRLEIRYYEEVVAPELTMISLNGDQYVEQPADDGDVHAPTKQKPHAVARYALLDTPEPVSSGDENFDGVVSQPEWTHAADRRFDLLDRAKAGKLTMESLRPGARRR